MSMIRHNGNIKDIEKRRKKNMFYFSLFLFATLFGVITLAVLLVDVFIKGIPWLDWQFLNSFPSRFPERAGIKSAFYGTLWMLGLTAPIAFILGVGTALYLNEYAGDTKLKQILQININNLAGVPSIVYGLLGLGVFVRGFALGRSLIAGSLTMVLLILPIIVVASQEALKSVPSSQRNASYALGATKWQTIRRVVIPAALPNILTGTILALSRAIGETAPLIMIGALTFVAFVPGSPMDSFTVLPIQIFNWTSRPQEDFQYIAAAGIIVLLVVLLSMNGLAIYLRNKYQNKY
ncbi:phosphate ABC transporter, permease protein PstA [Vulcanibacillus modesticaldus]|uniref:Phosphate transport system permease protein PstA n=2 Tax=Vulcanibacillus modesticaldus TaxID=337097 RepID=A0A1D2YSY6_9BACI|nr:phosphate ABC transporter, permease protein PstA [Vulcanibacillus modesticaldus]